MNEITTRRSTKILLIFGFLSLTVGIRSAYTVPADQYEVSIYHATPTLYWIGLATAVIASIVVLLFFDEGLLGYAAVLLAGVGTTSLISLPLLRGYPFYGVNDSLTHLGAVRALSEFDISPFDMIYPGSHLFAVFVHKITGFDPMWSMQLVVVLLTVLFFLFLPLGAYVLIQDRKIVFLTAFSAFLLLPVNSVGTHLMFHPFTMTLFFFSVVIYLLFRYTTSGRNQSIVKRYLSTGLLILFANVALVLFHPQVAINALIIFGTISGVQLLYRWRYDDHPIGYTQVVYGQTILLAVVFFAWTSGDDHAVRYLNQLIEALQSLLGGTDSTNRAVNQRNSSLSDIGVTLQELFVKIFLTSFVYVILSSILVVTRLVGPFKNKSEKSNTVVTFLTYSGIAMAPMLVLHNIDSASENTYLFRYIGFWTGLATLLGAIMLYYLCDRFSFPQSFTLRIPTKTVAVVLVFCFIALSWLPVFHSPDIYKRTQHVTEYQMSGYETAYDYHDTEVPFSGIRALRIRYADALYDTKTPTWSWNEGEHREVSIPEAVLLHNLSSYYSQPHYLPITDETYQSEVVAYKELRYSKASFRAIERTAGVHRVQSNGGFVLYYVEPADEPG